MAEVTNNPSALQSRLQAQLQSSQRNSKSVNLTPKPQDILSERAKARTDVTIGERRTPARQSERTGSKLSSAADIDDAAERVNSLNTNRREAPVGRISTQTGVQRNVPLGQIVDILV